MLDSLTYNVKPREEIKSNERSNEHYDRTKKAIPLLILCFKSLIIERVASTHSNTPHMVKSQENPKRTEHI